MKTKIFLLGLFSLLTTSCLTTSLNSIFFPNDIIHNDEIIGKWNIIDDSSSQNFLIISKSTENKLILTFHQHNYENNKLISVDTTEYIGNLGKIHSVLFLEFKPKPKEIYYPGLMIPSYHFIRISIKDNKMEWYSIPAKKLKRFLDKREFKLQANTVEDTESILITDNTKNIQKFLKEALKKKEFFELSSKYIKAN